MSSDINSEIGNTESGESFCTPIVLVVEDDLWTRQMVSRKLQAVGYEVVAVPSAADALIVSQRLVFHVLVLDLNLVDGDPFSGIHEGFAVIDWLRHQLGGFEFRVVIYTSQVEKKVVERAAACGAFAFCPKRRDMDNLLQCVHDAVASLNADAGESTTNPHEQTDGGEQAGGDNQNAAA